MLSTPVAPDYEGFLKTLRREGTPKRVHAIELGLDPEVKVAIRERFGLGKAISADDSWRESKLEIELQRFLGYDTVTAGVEHFEFVYDTVAAEDTVTGEQRKERREWKNYHAGRISSLEDFETYPWPDPARADTRRLEWLERNLPDDMCIVASGCTHMLEWTSWLMGYEPLCMALYDRPDFARAVFDRVGSLMVALAEILVQFDRVKVFFGGDDMGFKTSTLVSPEVLKSMVFPWHRKVAEVAHRAGKLYLLHSCGNLGEVMDALIDDVGIDGKHSFEDVICPVTEAKRLWGDRIAILGGIDVDLLTRASAGDVRRHVRRTLELCMPGGGYCLGTGNTVANYIPLDNYLAMLDEGRRFAP